MAVKNKIAFTLIEMIIVVVIIGILAAALIPKLKSVQEKARDTQRRNDIKNIYTSAIIYYEDYGDHPMSYCNFVGCHMPGVVPGVMGQPQAYESSDGSGGMLSVLVPKYLSLQPKDPINDSTYHYIYYYMGALDVSTVKSICGNAGSPFNPKILSEITYVPEVPTVNDYLRGCPGNISWDQILVPYGFPANPALWTRGLRLVNGETLGFKQN